MDILLTAALSRRMAGLSESGQSCSRYTQPAESGKGAGESEIAGSEVEPCWLLVAVASEAGAVGRGGVFVCVVL